MSAVKLFLGVSSSRGYLGFVRDKKLQEWTSSKVYKTINYVSEAGIQGLFGELSPSVLFLQNKDEVIKAASRLEQMSNKEALLKFNTGCIILTDVPIASTRKLQTAVKNLGGEVVAKSKEAQKGMGEELLADLGLTREVVDYLLEWSRSNPERLLSVIKFVDSVPVAKRKMIDLSVVSMQLTLEAGEVPVYEIESHILSGDFIAALKVARRSSSYNAVIGYLYSRVHTWYKVKSMLAENPRVAKDTLANTIGTSSGQMYYIMNTAKKLSFNSLIGMLKILAPLSVAVKSGEPLTRERFEVGLFYLCKLASGSNK